MSFYYQFPNWFKWDINGCFPKKSMVIEAWETPQMWLIPLWENHDALCLARGPVEFYYKIVSDYSRDSQTFGHRVSISWNTVWEMSSCVKDHFLSCLISIASGLLYYYQYSFIQQFTPQGGDSPIHIHKFTHSWALHPAGHSPRISGYSPHNLEWEEAGRGGSVPLTSHFPQQYV